MKNTVNLSMAAALVRFLQQQYIRRDGVEMLVPLHPLGDREGASREARKSEDLPTLGMRNGCEGGRRERVICSRIVVRSGLRPAADVLPCTWLPIPAALRDAA